MTLQVIRLLVLTLFAFLSLSLQGLAQNNQGEIRVGTFNIANFGDTQEYERSLISLVNIILEMNADLVCIQEVEPNQLGHDQVSRLRKLLNMATDFYETEPYDYAISGEYTGDEQTAFLWRDPVSIESEIMLLEHDEDPDNDEKPTFQRVPSVALFNAGNYDFYVVNCHLYTKVEGVSSEGREEELKALAQWLKDLEDENEKDAIVLGDFNRFLKGKKPWKKLMSSNYQNHYRFPLLEAIEKDVPEFDPKKDEAPSDQYSTTTSKKLSIYDQIIISKGSYNEFTSSPQFGEDVGIIDFDNDPAYEWFIYKWSNATKLLSDHRPVWIKIQIDLPDDD